MKRRNAEIGKMRRPVKRTKITEGMYGNSMLYLKFVMLWATVVMADYMLEFRFEFLWPFWMMLRSVYDSFKYQGVAFSVFFICIALTSDMICFFFIPLQYIFFAASTYVWVQYVWYTFADKGVCVPTVAICCVLVYVEGALRGERAGGGLCRPLAAHCVGYPVVTLGFGVKSLVAHRLRARRQRQVRAQNEFYFQLMRDAIPESALDQSQSPAAGGREERVANGGPDTCFSGSVRLADGALRRRCLKPDHNGHCPQEHAHLQAKLEKLEKHLSAATASRERDKSASDAPLANGNAFHAPHAPAPASAPAPAPAPAPAEEDDHRHTKSSTKSLKYDKKEASTLKEEKRKSRNRDKDKDKECSDSHKSIEHTKEHIVKDKEVESTKDCVKIKECNNYKEKEREREKEREKERERERETREREKEREREREREQREARECAEELKRVRAELASARAAEADAKRALAAAAAAERQRRADHHQLKQAHAALQHKMSTWRCGERATMERRLADERRARAAAEAQLLRARHAAATPSGECESESCRSRRNASEAEAATMRRELQRARDRAAQLQRDYTLATEQVRNLEVRQEQQQQQLQQQAVAAAEAAPRVGSWQVLQERAQHLERALSAETRVKLDLLSALGDANRKMHIQEGMITRQEKEIEELKAQMLAVMPSELVAGAGAGAGAGASKLRLDPNATAYTPRRLARCSDA